MGVKKASSPKPLAKDFPGAFVGLRKILQPYAANLRAKDDTRDSYYLETRTSDPRGKPFFFAAAKINKNYVSFHLMAAYCFPELLRGMSPELKKHLQGKACFNFSAPNPELFAQLAALTAAGARKFRAQKTP
ncbi:MAG: hypothetical protein WCA00_16080 [Candidatus Acidiferrales bacterium]